jgi:protein phosphatase
MAIPDAVDPALLQQSGWLFVIADGVSGYIGAQEASVTAVSTVMDAFYQETGMDAAAALEKAIHTANDRLHQRGQAVPDAGLRTTIAAALLQESQLVVANVGDSRAYLLQDGRLRQITADHKWVTEQVQRGLITEAEAAGHPFAHILTRSLGEKEQVQVDLHRLLLHRGDTVLLCSDGLYNAVPAATIERTLAEAPNAAAAARQLVDLAAQGEAGDDITAVVLRPAGGATRGAGAAAGAAQALSQKSVTLRQAVALVVGVILLVLVARLAWGWLSTPAAIPQPAAEPSPTARAPLPTAIATPATPQATARPATPTPAPSPAVSPTTGPTVAPTVTARPGTPSLPAAGVISVARWGMYTAVVYPQLPTDQGHGTAAAELVDGTKVQVVDAQVGWNAFPNETDGNLWYKIQYRDAAGQDRTGYVHASAVSLTP